MEGGILTRVVDGLERHLLMIMMMMMMMMMMIFTDAGAADADIVVLVVLIADWETDRLPDDDADPIFFIQQVFVSFVLAGNLAAADRRRRPISTNGKGVVNEEGDRVLGVGTVVIPSHLQ